MRTARAAPLRSEFMAVLHLEQGVDWLVQLQSSDKNFEAGAHGVLHARKRDDFCATGDVEHGELHVLCVIEPVFVACGVQNFATELVCEILFRGVECRTVGVWDSGHRPGNVDDVVVVKHGQSFLVW